MKRLFENYSIAGNVVTLTGVDRPLSAILLVADATNGKVIYSAATGGASGYTQGTNSTITFPTAPGASLQIFYDDGIAENPVFSSHRFSAGLVNFTPVATPTDFVIFQSENDESQKRVTRIVVMAVADTSAVVDLLFQRSPSGDVSAGSTSYSSAAISQQASSSARLVGLSANRPSHGNGISSLRPLIWAGKLKITSSAESPVPVDVSFSDPIAINDLAQEYLALNLNGQALPSNAKISVTIYWEEVFLPRVRMVGDSTTDLATKLFTTLWRHPALSGRADLRNHGANGMRLYDYINNTNSPKYSLATTLSSLASSYTQCQDLIVMRYGINDARQGFQSDGATPITQAYLVNLLRTAVDTIKTARPDVKIILHGCNPLTTDGNSGSYVATTGAWSGMTLAQASQAITDLLYNAHEAMRGYAGVDAVIQVQDIPRFGRICKTVGTSGLHSDILHPNAEGQRLIGNQIAPWIVKCCKL
jgi:lysophospholipase L1-like esterase